MDTHADTWRTRNEQRDRRARRHEGPYPGDLSERPDVETTQAANRGVRLAQGLG